MVSRICQEDTLKQEETNGVKNPPRRKTVRNQWRQESTEKTLKKKSMVSRIRQEELQQEYANGIKNPPRRITTRRNQWRQESAEKNYSKKKPMASRICREDTKGFKTPAEKNIQQKFKKQPNSKK